MKTVFLTFFLALLSLSFARAENGTSSLTSEMFREITVDRANHNRVTGSVGSNIILEGLSRPTDSDSERLVRDSGGILRLTSNSEIIKEAGKYRVFFKDGKLLSSGSKTNYQCRLEFYSTEATISLEPGHTFLIKETRVYSDNSGIVIYFEDPVVELMDCGNPVVSYPYVGPNKYDLTLFDLKWILGDNFSVEVKV